jgi:hemolysin activation/secretion protein
VRGGQPGRLTAAAAQAVALAASLLIAQPAAAQPFERPAQERRPLPRFEEPDAAKPELTVPELPAPDASLVGGPRVVVRSFEIEGSTVFTPEQLQAVVEPYVGREIGSEDLVAVRDALTRLYVDRGYVSSGAEIPDQDLADGSVRIRIVEGRLTGIEIEGARHFRPERLRRRVALGASTPLEVSRLEEALQILQQDPLIERVNARLRPGERPGEAVLEVNVEEARPWRLALEANNWANPAFGGYQGEASGGHANLLGFGDSLASRVRVAEGLVEVEGGYEVPVTARGTLLRVGGEWSDSKIVEDPFDELDIRTRYHSVRIGAEQPLYRTLATDLRVGVLGEWRRAKTEICVFEDVLGGCDPFAFPGSGADEDDGKTTVSVLRLSQELVRRDRNQVIAARSLLSIGLGILGATDQDLGPSELGVSNLRHPDGQFVAWLAQVQWARRFEPWGIEAIARVDAQVASDALPSLERFPVGGHLSVRGYRENQIVRDQGVVTSLEVRIPVWLFEGRVGALALAPFADFGHATNRRNPTPDPENLASVGIGLRWAFGAAEAELYWGHPLVGVDDSGDLQDDGVQFRVGVRVF